MGKGFNVQLVHADENLLQKIATHAMSHKIRKLAVDNLGVAGWRMPSKALKGKSKLESTTVTLRLFVSSRTTGKSNSCAKLLSSPAKA